MLAEDPMYKLRQRRTDPTRREPMETVTLAVIVAFMGFMGPLLRTPPTGAALLGCVANVVTYRQ